jgi:Gpi18-like mannosyltransferase
LTIRPTTIDYGRQRRPQTLRDAALGRARALDLTFPAVVFAVHWAFVTLFAALATLYAGSLRTVHAVGWQLPRLDGWRELVIQPLRNWDGFWYSLIATEGYDYHPATTAFWPLYPWSMRFVSELFGLSPEATGLLLANGAFFLALVVMYRLVGREWGHAVARRATLLLAFFPTAFYFSAVYNESFFLLFSLLAFYWGRGGKWWQAGVAGLLAALTRNVGVLLIIPLGIMFLRQYGRRPHAWPRTWLAIGIPVLGPLIYLAMLWFVYGDPLLTLDAQKGWAREQALPWDTFRMAFEQWQLGWLRELLTSPTWSTLTSSYVRFTFSEYESLDIIMTLLAIPLLVYCVVRLPIEYSAYTAIVFCLPLFSPSTIHPLMSMPRFIVVLFPLFIGLALLTRRRWTLPLILVPSCVLLALLTIQFSTWYWVA